MSERTGPRERLTEQLLLLTFARLTVNSAVRFVYPFLGAISRGLGISIEQAGFLVSARWAAGLATPLVTGTVGRRQGHRRQVTIGLALFSLGAAVAASFGTFAGAITGFAAMGLAKPSFDVAAQSYLADRVPYERRARSLGVFEMTWAGGFLIGAPAAGWLIARGDWATPFWVFAAILLAAALGSWVSLDDSRSSPRAVGKLDWDASALSLLAVMSLFAGGAEVLFVVFGVWLETSFGLAIVALGAMSVFIGVAELAGEGATVAVTDRIGKRRALAVGLALSAVGYALLIPGEDSLVLGLGALGLGLAGFEFAILSSVPLQTELKPGARAQLLSWTVVSMGVARAIGAAVGPGLYGSFGLAGNAILGAILNVAAIVILLRWVEEPGPSD
ncbi:MAG: MFS transporter [Acidimicrobiia bacterium]|nr:MFS transporter [Acidimicrobiia bacterium]